MSNFQISSWLVQESTHTCILLLPHVDITLTHAIVGYNCSSESVFPLRRFFSHVTMKLKMQSTEKCGRKFLITMRQWDAKIDPYVIYLEFLSHTCNQLLTHWPGDLVILPFVLNHFDYFGSIISKLRIYFKWEKAVSGFRCNYFNFLPCFNPPVFLVYIFKL